MKLNLQRRRMRSNAFTLVELLVVLLILIAVAGVVIPVIPDILSRVHTGVASANLEEVAKKVGEFQALNIRLPSDLDSLMNAAVDTDIADILPGENTIGNTLVALTIGPDEQESLEAAGIDNVFDMTEGTDNVTFEAADNDDDSRAIDNVTTLAQLTDTSEDLLGLDASGVYVVFGIGHKSELVGSTMLDAPVHFPHEGSPNIQYERMLIAVDISDAPEPAKFSTVFAIEEGDAAGLNDHLAEYWEEVAE